MNAGQFQPVKLTQFELGLPLRYDIFDQSGALLGQRGERFTAALSHRWSQLGLDQVYALVTAVSSSPSAESAANSQSDLLRPHDANKLQRLTDNLSAVSTSILQLQLQLADNRTASLGQVSHVTREFVSEIEQDCAASLLVLFDSIAAQSSENDKLLAERCAQLSMLSIIIGQTLNYSFPDCEDLGMVGLLHDVALFGLDSAGSQPNLTDIYYQHSLRSHALLETMVGIDSKVLNAVLQVHESLTGDGFPRRLAGSRISTLARIVHLADCYLTLVSPRQPLAFPAGRQLHPADAQGYIMYHAARGRFEVNTVRALVFALSLYPAGSSVLLSDNSTATVVRSTLTSPARPVVALDSDRTSIIDLRYSQLKVSGPHRQSARSHIPLRKSQLSEIYWV
jgi:HD-GYP domain-containing protein (c-di-GMP phosphodiesterase class II)